MKSIILFALTVGCALGSQPGIWLDPTTYPRSESDYIILGEDAADGAFPFMLSLKYEERNKHACGASLLTKKWALTAAHCCEPMSQLKMVLYAGSNSLSKGGKTYKIEKYFIHPSYKPSDYWKHDACLLKIKDTFEFGEKVQQITLPPQNWPVNDGDVLTAMGWGYTNPVSNVIPDKLQVAKNFTALSPARCKKATQQEHVSYLCVYGGIKGQGVCNGDSGSPLLKNGVQVGIASWVYLPCGSGKPDFFARVPSFIDWIKTSLGDDAKDLKFHKGAF